MTTRTPPPSADQSDPGRAAPREIVYTGSYVSPEGGVWEPQPPREDGDTNRG
ncbi:MAG TPA: hypothetical protein VM864_06425 [Pyrinomonadaceae bacterium]|jgi:hypothetical protein|nr:hypothetical protein [Pyrinomonadaceae bacterium]